MHARSPASAVLSLVLAALIGSAAPSQKPAVNVLSAENQTAGMTRTGAKFGPTPVGGRRGSIALNRPGATHEKLAFARGKIPSVAAGGPDLYEIPILGIPHEHVQDIEPIGDWSKGAAYFAVTHSQDNSGHFFILKTKNVATAPNDHEIFDDPTRVDGEGVYYEKYHQFARAGQYNHPGDISAVGNILVIAAQNWPGSPFAKLQIGPKAAPDAVLFYDVVNPEKPKFLGKLPIAKIAPKLLDLSNLWAGKIGDNYYMSLGDGTRTFYFYSSEMSPSIAKWKPAIATGVGFRGDTILTLRIEGTSTPVNLSVSPAVDDYQVVDVSSSQAGAQLIFSGAVRSYDIADSAFKARGSASGDYVSKRGRMSQVSIDRGFRGLLIALESYSLHYAAGPVRLPPGEAFLPLSDSKSWGKGPSYYETIQSCDLDGDAKAEIIARGAQGLVAWTSDGKLLPGVLPFSDSRGWTNPSAYKTIQCADVDGDGRDEVLARSALGLFAFSHTGRAWKQLAGSIAFTNAAGFSRPEYYETIQTADINGDGREEVLARTAFGVFAWHYDGKTWRQLPGSVPLSDRFGFNKPQYYLTIQSADLDGDGRAELIGRNIFGLFAYRYTGTAWVQMPGTIAISDAAGFDRPEYYGTLQAADIDGDGSDEILIRFAAGLYAYSYRNARFTKLSGQISLLSDKNGFKLPGNWATIQCADLDGDDRCEVLARYFWGLTASKYENGQWKTVNAVPYVGDYNRYDKWPYASTMQSADLDGDGRAEFLVRLVSGLHRWSPESLGFSHALPIGVQRIGAPTSCQSPVPQLNVNGRPLHTRRDFRLIAQHAPAQGVGLQAFSGAAWIKAVDVLGARLHVNLLDPSFFTLIIIANQQGRHDLPLPLAGSRGIRFYTQSLWVNPKPCSGRFFSSSAALGIRVQ